MPAVRRDLKEADGERQTKDTRLFPERKTKDTHFSFPSLSSYLSPVSNRPQPPALPPGVVRILGASPCDAVWLSGCGLAGFGAGLQGTGHLVSSALQRTYAV